MDNLTSKLAGSPVTLVNTNNYLQQIADNVVGFLNSIAPFVYVVVGVALFAVGLIFIAGTDRAKQAAKEKIPHIIIGTLLCLGPTIIAQALTTTLAFTS